MGWLLFAPTAPEPDRPAKRTTLQDSCRVAGPRTLTIAPDTPFEKKLQSIVAAKTSLNEPLFTVAGRVVASLRPDEGKGTDNWQFDSPEITSTFHDLRKAEGEIAFARTQLVGVQELAKTRVESQTKVVERLKKDSGTVSLKDLAAEQTILQQFELQGKKEVHEAQNAILVAQRNAAAAARQLELGGLDPALLKSTESDTDIVMADVPEGRIAQVQVGLGCEAKFFGIPDQYFHGKVNRVLRVLSKDRHSLRVLFLIRDPKDQIRPGMFAEIGLGTDARETILIPTEAILHIGRADYVLIHDGGNNWRVTDVKVGDLHGERVEILDKSLEGQRILTKGAILLKPLALLALQPGVSANGGAR
jgi:cobalt-zinc-cadmium efflux system membrane fusion protein